MRRFALSFAVLSLVAVGATPFVQARQGASKAKAEKAATMPAMHHTALAPADLKWGPAPPVLPAGAQVAVLDGDPFKPGFFALRLKMPDGYKVMPHTHPTDENIVVIQGTFKIGAGDSYSDASAKDLPTGGFVKMPKGMHHFAGAKGETIVQIYGEGPFVITYLNPADDPSKK
jgi:quercetin dioxygenase-like cupin family protein